MHCALLLHLDGIGELAIGAADLDSTTQRWQMYRRWSLRRWYWLLLLAQCFERSRCQHGRPRLRTYWSCSCSALRVGVAIARRICIAAVGCAARHLRIRERTIRCARHCAQPRVCRPRPRTVWWAVWSGATSADDIAARDALAVQIGRLADLKLGCSQAIALYGRLWLPTTRCRAVVG